MLLTFFKLPSVSKIFVLSIFEWPLKAGITVYVPGAQWLSGKVLNSRPRGRGFEPHQCYWVVSLSKTHLS